jgi:2-keto-3-deoxy-L-arabinonate dehydratase
MENPHMAAALTGVVPVVPTIFHDDESVDLGGTARVVDYLMDAGADGLCLLANYSEQFSLTDAERDAIARMLLEHVAGRVADRLRIGDRSEALAGRRVLVSPDEDFMLMPGTSLPAARLRPEPGQPRQS